MEYHQQTDAIGRSLTIQLKGGEAKELQSRNHNVDVQAVNRKVAPSFELVSRPKSSLGQALPSYAYASKYPQTGRVEKSLPFHTRQVNRASKHKSFESSKSLSAARRGKTAKQPHAEVVSVPDQPLKIAEQVIKLLDCQIPSEIPTIVLKIICPPTATHPWCFSAFIKDAGTLKCHVVGGGQSSFLGQPIASGGWYGLLYSIQYRSGRTREVHRLFGQVTWGEFLEDLHDKHPTGTYRDVAKEDDDDPEHDWEFFKVVVSLFYGSEVAPIV